MAVHLIGGHRIFKSREFLNFRSYSEPVRPVVGLGPPAVCYTEVQDPIDDHFLAARTARLEAPAWSVHPQIDPLDQLACRMEVVVLQEQYFPQETFVIANFDNLFDQFHSHPVARMGFARENEMDRAFLMVHYPVEPIKVRKEQCRPFVGGKAPGKTDYQGGGIDFRDYLFP